MSSKWYIAVYNPEMPPRYVERGLGLGKVELTPDMKSAKRYDSYEQAQKIAEQLKAAKKKERGAEHTAIDIIEEKPPRKEPPPDAEWITQMQFAWGKDLAAGTLKLQILKFEGEDWYRWVDSAGKASPPEPSWMKYASVFMARASEVIMGKLLDYEAKKAKK